ncbi:TonB family protein [Dialister invisus]|uniref:TonB family protein n=1 Tax=Dialister invisus TaxID=218538 RepID=UPI002E7A8AA7|nr:TonB family protein [Dialister invisus]MEE0313627.1 TonB family protein [Dialister invisus]
MNDRQRYAVGIAAAVLVHLFAVVMLGLFGVKYMEVPFRGEVLQVSLDAGGGNRGGGGSKGRKAPAAKSSEAKINDAAEPVEMPSEEINEKVPKKKPEPQERADKKKTEDTTNTSVSDTAAEDEGTDTQGDGGGSGGGAGNGEGAGTGDGSGTDTGEGDGNGSGPGAGVPITPPTVISKVLPIYPPTARVKETTGVTYVTVLVNTSGTVDSAYVTQGSGSSVLDAAAVDAAYQWTFSPALDKYGVPVPCRITFPVEFRLN